MAKMPWYKYITVEVPLLMCTFAMMLQMAIIMNLYIYRACYTILDYPKDECAQLGNKDNNITNTLEPLVQPTANRIYMVESTIRSTVPLLFCMYVGTWSDKFGRKPFMLLCLIGLTLSVIIITLVVHFEDLSPWWFIITSIPSILTGGFTSLLLIFSAYITDVTNSENRAIRLSMFEVILATSSFSGNMLSSYLLYATSYQTVFIISSLLMGSSFVYSMFFISESLEAKEKVPKLKDLFKYISFKDIIECTFKKREHNARAYIWMLLGVMVISGVTMGEMNVITLFLRAKFHWTLPKITLVNSLASVGNILATVIGMSFLYKIVKIKEVPLALGSIILCTIASILRGVATNDGFIYAAYALITFRGIFGIMTRTLLTYLIAPDEMGKFFAVHTILMGLTDTLSNLTYTNVYNATLETNEAAFNYLTAGIYAVVCVIVTFMLTLKFPFLHKPQDGPNSAVGEEPPKKISLNINNFETLSINEKRVSSRLSLEIIDTRTMSLR